MSLNFPCETCKGNGIYESFSFTTRFVCTDCAGTGTFNWKREIERIKNELRQEMQYSQFVNPYGNALGGTTFGTYLLGSYVLPGK